jgi:SagB-type dehydrogenase family enzyme
MPSLHDYRNFLKDSIRLEIDFSQTDQHRGVEPPPIQKSAPSGAARVALAKPGQWQGIGECGLADAIARRESRREYRDTPLTLDEIAFLLWATQGVRAVRGPAVALRTVPSAGCRHALETYLCVLRVTGLDTGIYRYLPLDHELVLVRREPELETRIAEATLGQRFTAAAAVTFAWTAIPYRMEWRYSRAAHKVIALDAGHVCQNLYLACEAIGAGTCAIAAYHQELMDDLLGVDGEDEFTIYMAPVGKVK